MSVERVIHTIPVPAGWSAEQSWEAIRHGDQLPPGTARQWANVLTDDQDHFIRMLPSDLSELSE